MSSLISSTRTTPSTEPDVVSEARSQFHGRRVHMIGVGGCGMSGLAEVLLRRGAKVSGTDLAGSIAIDRLMQSGASLEVAREPGPLPGEVDLVVASSAIPPSHPQRRAALELGCRVVKYAELLGELMRERIGLAVAGTHGKSTTTAWTAYTLRLAGLDPTFVVGAHVPQLGGGASVGNGRHFVAEACEYDRSFHHLSFRFGAILNVEEDHLDYYSGEAEIEAAFADFAARTDADGTLVVNHDDDGARRLADQAHVPIEGVGLSAGADWRAVDPTSENGCFTFDIQFRGESRARAALQLAGRHHITNALTTAALAHHCGVEPEVIALALNTFEGAHRRLTRRGIGRGVTVLDDYAHHPTEIRATLQAARERYAPKRMWVVFQPHQHSRTRFFLDDFAASFSAADVVVVPDIYFVRDSEAERQSIGAGDLVDRIRANGRDARYFPDFSEIVDLLIEQAEPGDAVITMGAGNIWQVADELVVRLGNDC